MGLLPTRDCTPTLPDTYCNALFETGEALAASAWRQLQDYAECGTLDTYVSLGEPPADCCLAAETEVVTAEGVRPIGSLAGRRVQVMTTDGAWVTAPIRSFGVQPLMAVTLTRRREQKVIYATPEHRWLLDKPTPAATRVRPHAERTTEALRVGDVLAAEEGQPWDGVPDPKGIAAGIVFGDGSADRWGSRVCLYGKKAALAPFLAPFGHPVGQDKRYPESVAFGGLGADWKMMPDADGDLTYLAGWLAGYIATDGSVSSRAIRLVSSVREHMERVREIAYRLGIVTTKIAVQHRLGYGTDLTPLFSISFLPETFPDTLLVRADQRAVRPVGGHRHVARWRVQSVEMTDRVEEVFCATVPGTRAFVLADNILTGNCDELIVWLTSFGPTSGWRALDSRSAGSAGYPTMEASWRILLIEACLPGLEVVNDRPVLPPTSVIHEANRYVYAHGMALYSGMIAEYLSGEIFGEGGLCPTLTFGPLLPVAPEGGCGGWRFDITGDLAPWTASESV